MSEIEPRKRSKKTVAARHIPQVIVPVAISDVRSFVRDALTGTSLADPIASALSGWGFFEPHLRFTAVDPGHTRIELDVIERVRGADVLLFVQRRGEIDRFFVAVQDELDRRERWQPRPPDSDRSIEGAD